MKSREYFLLLAKELDLRAQKTKDPLKRKTFLLRAKIIRMQAGMSRIGRLGVIGDLQFTPQFSELIRKPSVIFTESDDPEAASLAEFHRVTKS